MSLTNLDVKRQDLQRITAEILNLFSERARICHDLQNLKSELQFSTYDIHREKLIYQANVFDLSRFSLKEIFALSLLIEDHAGGVYPQWSKKIHLKKSTDELFEMINPLILQKTFPDLFNRLVFSDDFAFFRDL